MVPVDEVLARDRGDSCVFGDACIRVLGAIGELYGFAVGDVADFVIAPRDAIESFTLRQFELIFAELRLPQQIGQGLEDITEIFFQAGERNGGRVGIAIGLNFCRAHFQVVVELVASLILGATSAPDFCVE